MSHRLQNIFQSLISIHCSPILSHIDLLIKHSELFMFVRHWTLCIAQMLNWMTVTSAPLSFSPETPLECNDCQSWYNCVLYRLVITSIIWNHFCHAWRLGNNNPQFFPVGFLRWPSGQGWLRLPPTSVSPSVAHVIQVHCIFG